MKISKKQKAKFITSFDKYIFIVPTHDPLINTIISTEVIILDDKEDVKNIARSEDSSYPEHFNSDTLISGDEMEDVNVFEKKCKEFCNPDERIYAIFVDNENSYAFRSFDSRSAFLKELSKHEKVYAFAGDSYVYVPDADNHSEKLMPIEEDAVVCLHLSPNRAWEHELSVWTPKKFCEIMFGDTPLSSKVRDAVGNGFVFKSGYDVPVTDLLTLAPWEIRKKYPGLVILPSASKNQDVAIKSSDFFVCNDDYWFGYNLNECRETIIANRTALNWFAACTVTEDRFPDAMRKFAPRDKFAIIETPGQALTYDTPITIVDQPSACNALEGNAFSPILAHGILANGTDRAFYEYAGYDNKWYILVYDEKEHINRVFGTSNCHLPIMEILESQGYDIMLFQNTINLDYPKDNLDDVGFIDILTTCHRTVYNQLSIVKVLNSDEVIHKTTVMLCMFFAFGYLSETVNSDCFTVCYRNGYLYSPQVAEHIASNPKPASVWHTEKLETQLTNMANTLYRLLFVDRIFEYRQLSSDSSGWVTVRRENDIYAFMESKLRYIKLMCNSDEGLPIKDIFTKYNQYELHGLALKLEM